MRTIVDRALQNEPNDRRVDAKPGRCDVTLHASDDRWRLEGASDGAWIEWSPIEEVA